MRKSLLVSLVMLVAFASLPSAWSSRALGATAGVAVALDGVNLAFTDAKPFVDAQKRVLVPLRFVSEKLGTTVDYQEAQGTVSIKSDSLDITLKLGSQKATVNGVEKNLGTQPVLKNSRAYVPLRFVSEALGRRVVWDGANNTAHIWNLISDKVLEEQSAIDWMASGISMPAHVSYHYFDAKDGKLTFEDSLWDGPMGPYKGYSVSEKITPDLSKKAYQMVKYLANDEQYTSAHYWPETSNGTSSSLAIAYAVQSRAVDNDNYYFRFSFPEKTYYSSFASKKVTMRLIVNRLFWNEESGRNFKVENKLRMALVALYGDSIGISMFNWIMCYYNSAMVDFEKLRTVKTSKTFGNVQIDLDGTGVQLLTFSFSSK
ncbi:copper amine oxidase N-terminal domain-containing protein [Cohnella sp. AR92]|uniref:copper amine oxidase N-terminal domain-containing protein n=1 Tax=Cohnella sp. AR92 TaxID=648716 RepID=UPI000F8C7C35|nr:copper amine oxidase N-terminal domain-containing protein [Cohnella sp. AR92]RUS47687.1 copper amine oxidase N-terminal domain-containing protein [Cohnella sp. AR92]